MPPQVQQPQQQNDSNQNQQNGQVGPFMVTPEEARRRMSGDKPPFDPKKLGIGVVIYNKKVAIAGIAVAVSAMIFSIIFAVIMAI